MKRGSKEEEREWRNVIKLGSIVGDWEEIQGRKELATVALAKDDNLEKELENKADNQNPAVRDASKKCTVVQLRNLGFSKV